MCENYLLSSHKDDVIKILKNPDKDKYFSLNINFLELFESDTNLANALLTDPEVSIKNWNEAVFTVQSNLLKEPDDNYTLKNNINCRIYNLPPWPHVCRTIFPGNDDANKFLQVTGTVIRMSARKLLEYQRQYICTKCKYPITVEAKYDKRNIIKQPTNCPNPEGCPSRNIISFGELDTYNCKDYQEIKIQEDLSKLGVGTVPNHMVVTLEDDLVNTCKPGENVTITGIVVRRWSEFDKGAKIIVDIVLKANHVQVNNSSGLSIAVSDETKWFFNHFWQGHIDEPLVGRNVILQSISPEIYGVHLVKLAIAIVLAGGSQNENNDMSTGIDTRSESHLLLVGDPGTGKSQMLRFASRIVPRSVLTTGVGSTAAGLTVTAVMENGEWQLEAGALVMADGGICCIDEFNSMKEHDRTSIHEAMEQQTISVAKAGMVCKLKTRCTILAACNPKGNINPSQPLCVNVAMSSPLLSRFDLILLLRDVVNQENDRRLAEYLLNKSSRSSNVGSLWSLEKLQSYYAVIKKRNPKLTNDAEIILSTYYQLQRKFGNRNKSRTTVRLLESLIRLSQGHAKLMYHTEVQVLDAIFAVMLIDCAMDHESSILNLRFASDAFSDNPEEQYWGMLENILEKLNLDYIYQKEIENCGKKNSGSCSVHVLNMNQEGLLFQNSGSRATTKCSQGLFTQKRQNIVDSVEKGGRTETRLLFSQSSSSQQSRTLRNTTNCSFSQNLSQLFSKGICDEIDAVPESPFLKRRKRLNDTEDSGNYSDVTRLNSQSMSASVNKNSYHQDGPSTSKDTEGCNKMTDLKSEQNVEKGKKPMNLSQMVRLNNELDLEVDVDLCFHKMESFVRKNKDDLSVKNTLKAQKLPSNTNETKKSNSSAKSIKNNIGKELDLIKLMPSVNDDFLNIDNEIDWSMEEEICHHGTLVETRHGEEVDKPLAGSKRHSDFKEDASINIKKKIVDCDEKAVNNEEIIAKGIKCIAKSEGANEIGSIEGRIMEKAVNSILNIDEATNFLTTSKETSDLKVDEVTKPRRSFENLLSKFSFQPREQRKSESETSDSLKESIQNIDPGEHNDKLVNSGSNVGISNTKDNNAATENTSPNSGKKLNFKRLNSKMDFFSKLDEEIESLETSIFNPLENSSWKPSISSKTSDSIDLKSKVTFKENPQSHKGKEKSNFAKIIDMDFENFEPDLDFKPFTKKPAKLNNAVTASQKHEMLDSTDLKSKLPSKEGSPSHKGKGKSNIADIIDMHIENFESDLDFNPFVKKPAKLNDAINASQKHEMFDMSQNSKRGFIKKKFVFKKLDAKKLLRSDFGE